ncbi:histidine phosphatase family protein [Lactiplantibacillus pentosus]|uniref:histidine phosphatase family protein n=1 Tax=Lactiplantibacillus pentosus TaxID=1589 RepID=UPI00132FDFC3|nr:histidine phosphatase family protein [Lactiplantibacillus pentosus]MBQ0835278.1 histidine phosphatase family protein [Lactiplantibacillus pentosus]MBU7464883.1 histidine phosphatase family protein [Lactiplantibacillus pentosus]MBU7491308.1 histidine phosphatase family protein [Lactiplantibacillus pentosus]MBU7492530.1 histidine phosphatase family protein [Lactiplantibacillus pentosus]MBU7518410.1 histidine phosphatase family protein [Lactiplantibacillus pentosus]
MKVYLIRHSEPTYQQATDAGLQGFGRELSSLTENGVAIAQKLAQQPLFDHVQLILASPYTRALQTALEIVRFNDIPLKVELGLREWQPDNTGSRTDTDEQASVAYQIYRQHAGQRVADSPLHYETAAEVKSRVLTTLSKYAQTYDCIACVTHGEVMRQFGDQQDVAFCGVRKIIVD